MSFFEGSDEVVESDNFYGSTFLNLAVYASLLMALVVFTFFYLLLLLNVFFVFLGKAAWQRVTYFSDLFKNS